MQSVTSYYVINGSTLVGIILVLQIHQSRVCYHRVTNFQSFTYTKCTNLMAINAC